MAYLLKSTLVSQLIFVHADPAQTDATVDAVPASLDERDDVHRWPDGHEAPSPCVGRHADDETEYVVFRDERAMREAGYVFAAAIYRMYDRLSDVPPEILKHVKRKPASA